MRVYVTRDIPEDGIEMLKNKFDVEVNTADKQLSKKELIEKIIGCDAVLSSITDTIDGEVMDSTPSVKIFANYAVGFNNLDVEAARERSVVLTNTPGVLSDTTAETAWALMFATARRVVEADRYLRAGQWKKFSAKLLRGQDIHGKTLGVVGAGRIGRKFAEKSRGFNMRVLYYDQQRNAELEQQLGAKWVELEELLNESDFVSLHVPLTPETRHMIGECELKLMKKTAVLINTARGPVVDERALVRALQEGEIWGAGLDVFENEPEVSPELLKMDNVVLLPHIGSASTETRSRMSEMAARNIIEVLEGREAINPVY